MERRHIAVFTHQAAGHVYPALGLCSELVTRGHRVTYPINERFAARVREAGATPLEFKVPEIRHADKVARPASLDDSELWRPFIVFGPLLIATAAALVAELEDFYARNPPDLILYERFSFAGRILARRLGCPALQVGSHFAHRNSLLRLDGVCMNPEPMLPFAQLVDALMSTYGFEGKGHLWHVEDLNIYFIPREFQFDIESFDRRFLFVGATHNRKPRAAVWKNRAQKGQPLLLMSENTASGNDKFLNMCVEAFAGSRYHVVFSKGLNSPEVSTQLPDNFEINREAFNCDILPFAKVMVCQGGMGTTLESLYHGVPAVVLPPPLFNSEVGYRVAELSLGAHVPERGLTARMLREAVDATASDEALLTRVKRMQDRLRNDPGPEGAADAIEKFLG